MNVHPTLAIEMQRSDRLARTVPSARRRSEVRAVRIPGARLWALLGRRRRVAETEAETVPATHDAA